MVDLDDLRTAFRGSWPEDASEHLSETAWELLASDGLEATERGVAIDHILDCPQCAEVYRAVLVVRSGARAFDPDAPKEGVPSIQARSMKRRWWGGLGVVALAATVVLVIVLPPDTSKEPATGPDPTILRSAGDHSPLTPVAPVEEAISRRSTDDLVFRWEAHDREGPFFVEILDGNGELLWTSPQTMTGEIVWHQSATALLGRYYWRVLCAAPAVGMPASELVSFDLVDEGVNASRP